MKKYDNFVTKYKTNGTDIGIKINPRLRHKGIQLHNNPKAE